MATQAGNLVIDIAANVARLRSDMAETKKTVKGAMGEVSKSVDMAKRAIGALGLAVGAGALIHLARQAMDAIDANAKLADRLGFTTEKLQGLKLAAELAGVQQETIITGMRTMQYQAAQAAQGVGIAATAFSQLGINAQSFVNLSRDQQLDVLLDKLRQVGNVTQRNALAYQIFGGRASEMLNLISEGAEGIRQATADAEAWGLALSRVDSAKVEAANDALTRVKAAMQGVANTIVVQLSPYVQALGKRFTDAAKDARGWRDEVVPALDAVANGVAYVADAVHFLKLGFRAVQALVSTVFGYMLQGIAAADRALTDFNNRLAGTFIGRKLGIEAREYNDFVQFMAKEVGQAVDEVQDKFVSLANEPLPHAGVKKFFADLKREAQAAAQEVAKVRGAQGAGGTFEQDPGKAAAQQAQEQALLQKALAARLKLIEKHVKSERQLKIEAYAKERADLVDAVNEGLITQAQANAYGEQLELQHQAAMGNLTAQGALARLQFEQQTAAQKTATVLGQLVAMTAGIAAHNKLAFKAHQAFAIAEAIVSAYKGISLTLGAYIFPLNVAMAAAHAAVAFAQIQQIRKAKFGDSTSAPSISGGAAVPTVAASDFTQVPSPVLQQQQAQAAPVPRTVNVYLSGDGSPLSQEYIRDSLFPAINDALGDGLTLNVAT